MKRSRQSDRFATKSPKNVGTMCTKWLNTIEL